MNDFFLGLSSRWHPDAPLHSADQRLRCQQEIYEDTRTKLSTKIETLQGAIRSHEQGVRNVTCYGCESARDLMLWSVLKKVE